MHDLALIETLYKKHTYTIQPNGCWLWDSNLTAAGYGYVCVKRRSILAHRIALMLSGVPVGPKDLVLHSCDSPSCVNPDHLRTGTHKENTKDMMDRGRHGTLGKKKSHCVHGHEYKEGSYFLDNNNYRRCKACRIVHNRKGKAA